MITAITPNPALDITYYVDAVTLHATNRVQRVEERPGGKGVNVARIVDSCGLGAEVGGFLGGRDGSTVADLLAELAPTIKQSWCTIEGTTRRTIAVADQADTTMLNEPGPQVTDDDWDNLYASVAIDDGPVIVSGSFPKGSSPDNLRRIIEIAHQRNRLIVVDTSGPLLMAAARSGADVLKPNIHELSEVTDSRDPLSGAHQLLDMGAKAVVVSQGEEGMLLFLATHPDRYFKAKPYRQLVGNPTGAGDAAVAAFAMALNNDKDLGCLVDALPSAVAMSGAAVLSPVAGEIDHEQYEDMKNNVTVEKVDI